MVLYVGKRFDATQVGSFVVGVKCDKCGCEYFYEFTRTGTGASEAPFSIGTASAASSAQEKAKRDMKQRLASESDLVPCPKCNWINDELVGGYRLGRYRGCSVLAFAVALLGTIAAMLSAWYISIGPPSDRGAVPYFLFGGPTLFVCLAAVMLLLRKGLRNRIQPNRNFPQRPKVPTGSPRAMVQDQDGQFRLADPLDVNDGVDVPMGNYQFPELCCDCLQSATPANPFRIGDICVPRCVDCARRDKRRTVRLFFVITIIGFILGGAGLVFLENLSLRILIAFGLAAHIAISNLVAVVLTATVSIVRGERRPGIVRLWFRNTEYARLVAQTLADIKGDAPRPSSTSIIADGRSEFKIAGEDSQL